MLRSRAFQKVEESPGFGKFGNAQNEMIVCQNLKSYCHPAVASRYAMAQAFVVFM